MSQRIRYVKTGVEGVQRSVKTFSHTTNGGRFYVLLNLNDNSFTVMDETADAEAKVGAAKSPHKLKIAAKEALSSLGIDFEKEDRRDKAPAEEQPVA